MRFAPESSIGKSIGLAPGGFSSSWCKWALLATVLPGEEVVGRQGSSGARLRERRSRPRGFLAPWWSCGFALGQEAGRMISSLAWRRSGECVSRYVA